MKKEIILKTGVIKLCDQNKNHCIIVIDGDNTEVSLPSFKLIKNKIQDLKSGDKVSFYFKKAGRRILPSDVKRI